MSIRQFDEPSRSDRLRLISLEIALEVEQRGGRWRPVIYVDLRGFYVERSAVADASWLAAVDRQSTIDELQDVGFRVIRKPWWGHGFRRLIV